MWSAAVEAYALLPGLQQCTAEVIVLQRCCRSLPSLWQHVTKGFATIPAGGRTVGQQCKLCDAVSVLVPCQRLLAWKAWMGLQHTRLSRRAQPGAQTPPYLGYAAQTALQTPLDLYATARKKVMTQFASSLNSA